MKNIYDMVASLGGNCSAAIQLKNRGLRCEAYPLDWVYMESEISIRWLIDGFANRFADFALKENLQEMSDGLKTGVAKYSYRDAHTGFCMIHHFNESVCDVAAYERQMAIIRRRIDRFFERIAESKRILFILTVRFPINPQLVMELKDQLGRLYPGKLFDVHVKEFNAVLSAPHVLAESWPCEYGFAGGERYRYDAFPYSFDYASKEWEFLDDIEITDRPLAKPKGWAKVIYKIWKKSSKWLNDRGYGVRGVKFGGRP